MNNKANKTSFKKGHRQSEESRKKMSLAKKGKPSWNKGKKLSKEHIEKLKKSHLGKMVGENNPRYSGGNKLKRQEKEAGRKKPEQCEVCGSLGRICFDHDHNTGSFRGWICARCNIVLGLVKDNKELLKSLERYLYESNL